MGPAVARYSQESSTRQCPKCGSSQICRSRRRNLLDMFLGALLLNPYRCTQCLRRFFGFGSSFARRIVAGGLCLLPLLILIVWFTGLYRLHEVRAVAPASEPANKKTRISPNDVNRLLNNP